jgi:hypothetical protein
MPGSDLPVPPPRPSGRDRRHAIRLWLRGLLMAGSLERLRRHFLADLEQWQCLAAYRGLVQQAFRQRPFAPQVSADVWIQGRFQDSAGRSAFFNPAQRELQPSSHHYGHDVQLKRYAGLHLLGRPLPLLLEHGLKVSRWATFEAPRSWSRGYLCMMPLLAHSWDRVKRRMDLADCVAAVQEIAAAEGYRSVIWLRHWQDPPLPPLPEGWIVACNGHRSNPWFLDALRILLQLSDGLATNAFGTHLGYAVALERRLHWVAVEAEQDLSRLAGVQATQESEEWGERQRLSGELHSALAELPAGASAALKARRLRPLLDPYWGFGQLRSGLELGRLLAAPRSGATPLS